MQQWTCNPLDGKRAVLATMHGKQQVIAPLVERLMNVTVTVPAGFDTDVFGTFSREVERQGSQLDAARAKIAAALANDPHAAIGIASEGSFGPDPGLPFLPLGFELVVLQDRQNELELAGCHADRTTNYGHQTVTSVQQALGFAGSHRFPSHALLVMGSLRGEPAPQVLLRKGIATPEALAGAIAESLSLCGAAHVETDMRAHCNPTRMRAIKRATIDLIRRYRSICPACKRPGFAITQRLPGLACEWCLAPTSATRATLQTCSGCNYCIETAVTGCLADPRYCYECNP